MSRWKELIELVLKDIHSGTSYSLIPAARGLGELAVEQLEWSEEEIVTRRSGLLRRCMYKSSFGRDVDD
jgi:hypothetical protein